MRYTRRKIRKKRFLFPKKKYFPSFYSRPKKILTLAYDYEEDIRNETDYLERIHVAIEQFNSLELAHFVYRPFQETQVSLDCPFDELALKEKHLNQILFGKIENPHIKMLGYSMIVYSVNDYLSTLRQLFNQTMMTITNFGGLGSNIAHEFYSELGIGALIHEMGHLFGIADVIDYDPEKTQGILAYNITQTELTAFYQACLAKQNNRTDIHCVKINLLYTATQERNDTFVTIPFTPLSMFSLYQYHNKVLNPFLIFNKTRTREILTQYGFSIPHQQNYFSLLDTFQGRNHLLTYQDLLALAYAIYWTAPETLVKRRIFLPYFRFIEGIYRSPEQTVQLIDLIHAFVSAENFSYPILMTNQAPISVQCGIFWQEDLIDFLKLVSLNGGPIRCYLIAKPHFSSRLYLEENCLLSGIIDQVGSFNLRLSIYDYATQINSIIEIESMPRKTVKDRVFVGKPIVYLDEGTTHVNVAKVCLAAAYPFAYNLKCEAIESWLQPYLEQCFLVLPNDVPPMEMNINFSSGEAYRRCTLIQVNKNQNALNFFAEPSPTKRYKRSAVSFDAQQFGAVSVVSVLESLHNPQLIYLITLPLLQGVFECCVEKSQWSPAISALLKVLPRISLIGLGLWSNFQWPVFLFYALFEAHVSTFLENRMDSTIKSLLFFLLFILMTEFEYGFSNLWTLAERPQLWSDHSEQFNQSFFQIIWAPLIKIFGYMATLALTESCRSDTDSQAEEILPGQEGEELGSPSLERATFFMEQRKVSNAPVLSDTTKVSITQDNDDVFPKTHTYRTQ